MSIFTEEKSWAFLYLWFRLNEASLQNISKQQPKKNKKKRMRRHRVRKILIVLDYIIDSVTGVFILLLLFIGENKVSYSLLFQRILFCFGNFAYGILTPIAHLLNESRVRNIIVKDGWFNGFISIFYSEKKMREYQTKQNNTLQMEWKHVILCYDDAKIKNNDIHSKHCNIISYRCKQKTLDVINNVQQCNLPFTLTR